MTEWIKASMSGDQGACVEQRATEGMIEVRDSKNRSGPVLRFTRAKDCCLSSRGARKANSITFSASR